MASDINSITSSHIESVVLMSRSEKQNEKNDIIKENADKTGPNMILLDISTLTPEKAAKTTDQWILKNTKDIK